ncbi:ATP-dependent RNA helicase HrpA [Spongiibacter nanhainus]|uniref:ATP-dependent RNA helicase HrpA n=1 Tax=Spongiibacter nanhainus TaxID=2794344 RepID=A0A7T4QYL3_9GAMM|nr:ATP-dependent RNA helicase HrpA [Spongiibacter nanhainus]QQD17188.1 ATP-dependent RNA helicase HrpA [Spongiibacter nanhainus]
MPDIDWPSLRRQIDQCYGADRFPLRRKLQQLQRDGERDDGTDKQQQRVAQFVQRLQRSVQRRQDRVERRPAIRYPEELPVSQRLSDIRKAIESHQVVVVAGETGSGKTTQIPKLCLEMGRGIDGMIAHTQPRRLAARTVAQRLAEELDTPLGEGVAYQVRFQDVSSPNSYIKLMTDGILLASIQQDRFLNQYDTLIIDEAHERSLNIDFLLGYLKTLLPKRPDLKVIITSATIDVERFSKHFDDAPVVEVSGRSYPVEYRYRPLEDLSDDNDLSQGVEEVLRELIAEGAQRQGDTLVFLSGERDIREVAKHLRRIDLPGAEVLPLYARLSNAEQQRIFDLRGRRGWRVVLATNVAETSLTVPGIRYVIDAGTARVSRYSIRSKVQRLPIEPVSQASANQRAGRCGRVAPGIAYRLYSEEDFDRRPAFTEPEIQRTNLAAVILQMLQLGLGDIRKFPFVDPPDHRLIRDGFGLLEELGAVHSGKKGQQGKLTERGKALGKFPVDPRIGRLLLAAAEKSCLREMLIIASALSIQDPRERPADKQQAADEKHRRFWHPESDFLAFVALWDYAEEQRQALSNNQWRKLCQKEFLSWTRMREWREVHYQLAVMCRQLKLKQNPQPADYDSLHQALLPGFLSQLAVKGDDREYLGARNRKLRIFPGSSQFKKSPKWIVAAELAETTQLYARCVARIEPDWVFGINDSLLKRNYYEPHWQAKTGRVMAYEQTLLHGLTIRDRHRVHYGPIDPVLSREILIRQGLVEGRYRGPAKFFKHNRALIAEVTRLEDKTRRRDILVSDEELFRFYDQRLPEGITTAKHLESWLKKSAGAEALKMTRGDVMRHQDDAGAEFPDQLTAGGVSYPLSYHFEPGHPADGVTVSVPLGQLATLPEGRLDWMVPGILRDKCIALVKMLPKAQRKQLVPVPDYVDRALQRMQVGDQPLLPALAEALQQISNVDIALTDWPVAELEDYYRMNIRVLDDAGKKLAAGRDIARLRSQLADRVQKSISQETGNQFETRAVTEWDFGKMADQHRFKQSGATLTAYPCLRDKGDAAELGLAESEAEANRLSERGVLRLLLLRLPQQVKQARGKVLRGNEHQLQFATIGGDRHRWVEMMLLAAARDAFAISAGSLPRRAEEFDAVWEQGRSEFVATLEAYEALMKEVLALYAGVRRTLKKANNLSWAHSVADINNQLSALFEGEFILAVDSERLQQYPRYLKAVQQRIDKLRGHFTRDRQCTLTLEPLQAQLQALIERKGEGIARHPLVEQYRWQLEEFRVSLFAQELGTQAPVSEKRLKILWKELQEAVTIT